MKQIFQRLALILVTVVLLVSCATTGGAFQARDKFPGGFPVYDFGSGQNHKNFTNLEQAQYLFVLSTWKPVFPIWGDSLVLADIVGMGAYSPLSVRWRLKDKREFIIDKFDMRPIMNDYFAKHRIDLSWQKERRDRDRVGDSSPALSFEIQDDAILLKWVIDTNRTPVDKRLTDRGAATLWDITQEQFIVARIPGTPTQNINFDDRWTTKP